LLGLLDGLIYGDNPGQGVFDESHFLHPDLGFAVTFPSGWEGTNSASAVRAVSPSEDAMIVLQLAQRPAEAAAAEFIEQAELKTRERLQSIEIGSLLALRTSGTSGRSAVEATWISFGENVYQLYGVSDTRRFDSYQRIFQDAIQSFAPIEPEELARIDVERLRPISAQPGEALAELAERAKSTLDREALAVMNAIDTGGGPAAGQLVKVPVKERYR
jgi:predicted Zn-dependent protease